MEAIRDVRYLPPGELDPDLPPALDAIVTRALAKDPQARYQWASELVNDLEGYLFSRGEPISARDVAEYIKGLVGGSRAVAAAEVLSPDPDPPTGATKSLKSRSRVRLPPSKQAPVLPPPPPSPDPTQVTATPRALAVPTEVGPPPMPPEPSTDVGPPPEATLPGARPARPLRAALVVLAFALAGSAGFAWQRLGRREAEVAPVATAPEAQPTPAPRPPPVAAPAPPPPVTPPVEAKDEVKPASQTTMAAVKPVAPPARPAKPPRTQPVAAAPAPPATRSDSAYLNLRSNRPAEILVDGKPAGRSPQLRYALPPGRHELRFDCIYDWGKAKGEVQSLYLVPYAEGDVTHECVEMARP